MLVALGPTIDLDGDVVVYYADDGVLMSCSWPAWDSDSILVV